MTVNAFGVSDLLGSGGAGLSPGGSGPSDGTKNLRDLLRAILGAIFPAYANATALTASKAANRQDGQFVVKLDDYSLWTWQAASSAAAGTTVIAPTDVGVGAGRWVQVLGGGGLPGQLQTGQATLVAGSATGIAATITANTKFFFSRQSVGASTAVGELTAASIVQGAPGSFAIKSVTDATPGTAVAGDVSVVNWLAIG